MLERLEKRSSPPSSSSFLGALHWAEEEEETDLGKERERSGLAGEKETPEELGRKARE